MIPRGVQELMRHSKDAALAVAARRLINRRIQALGQVVDLSLDSTNHSALVCLALRGETEPVSIDVRNYHIDRSTAVAQLTVTDAVASREWLTAALHQFVVGRPIPISSKAAVVIPLLA